MKSIRVGDMVHIIGLHDARGDARVIGITRNAFGTQSYILLTRDGEQFSLEHDQLSAPRETDSE